MTILNQTFARIWLSAKSLRDEQGQTTLEYALVVGVIVVAAAVGLGIFFDSVSTALEDIAGQI